MTKTVILNKKGGKNVKLLSVYRTTEGIIVDIRNELGKSEETFDREEDMLDRLDSLKKTGKLDDYELNVANEFWSLVINKLSKN